MLLNGNLILIGVISAAYGIKGEFVVKSFTMDPSKLNDLHILDKNHCPIKIEFIRFDNKGGMICRNPAITTRNAAEKLAKTRLYCKREDLPDLEEDEFYHNDLIGIEVRSEDVITTPDNHIVYKRVGSIKGVFNFGAGDIIEVSFDDGKKLLFPFTKEYFPQINKNYVVFKEE